MTSHSDPAGEVVTLPAAATAACVGVGTVAPTTATAVPCGDADPAAVADAVAWLAWGVAAGLAVARAVATGTGVPTGVAVGLGVGLGVGAGAAVTVTVPPEVVASPLGVMNVTVHRPGVGIRWLPLHTLLPFGGALRSTLMGPPGPVSRAITDCGLPLAVTLKVKFVAVVPVRGAAVPLLSVTLASNGVELSATQRTAKPRAAARARGAGHRPGPEVIERLRGPGMRGSLDNIWRAPQ
jgi:hypothetical protein